jgi:RES domain
VGAFVEVFQGFDEAIPIEDVRVRRISVLSVPREMHLADCTQAHARRFGVTAEIHSGTSREQTQAWARAFARDGFEGVRFFVRHDPAQRRVGVALFGPWGEATWPVLSTEDIGADLVLDVERLFGIRVLS